MIDLKIVIKLSFYGVFSDKESKSLYEVFCNVLISLFVLINQVYTVCCLANIEVKQCVSVLVE